MPNELLYIPALVVNYVAGQIEVLPDKLRGTERLARMGATARSQAQEAIYQILQPLLTQDCCAFLDGLLKIERLYVRQLSPWSTIITISP